MWDMKFMKKWFSSPKKSFLLFISFLIVSIKANSCLYKQILFVCLLVMSVQCTLLWENKQCVVKHH